MVLVNKLDKLMIVVDGNTGGIKYFGSEMTIFTTISYPVAEQ